MEDKQAGQAREKLWDRARELTALIQVAEKDLAVHEKEIVNLAVRVQLSGWERITVLRESLKSMRSELQLIHMREGR